jgi:transposase-like protein
MFKRRRFPVGIILACVRWYCKYGISYGDLAEMMQERGVEVDPSTIMGWVHHYARELEKRVRWYQGNRATSWRVDETYVKVGGKWKYLFSSCRQAWPADLLHVDGPAKHACGLPFPRKSADDNAPLVAVLDRHRPARFFQTMKTAAATIKGFEVMRMDPQRALPHV